MEVVMPEQFVLPIVSIFGPLVVATLAAWMLLNREDTRDRRRPGGK